MKKLRLLTLGTMVVLGSLLTNCSKKELEETSPQLVNAMREVPSNVGFENGMLVFEDQTHFDLTLNELNGAISDYNEANAGTYTEDEPDRDDPILVNPVLAEFENQFGDEFQSLRKKLEQDRRELMLSDTWGPENDPQNFYVPDDTYRTLLNDRLEVKIGGSIYKYIDQYTLAEVTNDDQNILDLLRANQFVGQVPNLTYHNLGFKEAATNACNAADIYATWVNNNINGKKIHFQGWPLNGSGGCSRQWTFGDGSSNNVDAQPEHAYTNSGKYIVKYQASCNILGGTCANTNYYVVATNPATNCSGNTLNGTFSMTPTGLKVNVTASVTGGATQIHWDFGNRLNLTNAVGNTAEHTYNNAGTYTIKMTAVKGNGCYLEQTQTIVLTGKPAWYSPGCEEENLILYTYNNYNPNVRRFYGSLWRHNAPAYHRMGAATRNYERKNNQWKDKNAELIHAMADGTVKTKSTVYGAEAEPCQSTTTSHVYCRRDAGNKPEAVENYPVGIKFATYLNGVESNHEVYYYGVWYKSILRLSN